MIGNEAADRFPGPPCAALPLLRDQDFGTWIAW
jgi:hypothetical protein